LNNLKTGRIAYGRWHRPDNQTSEEVVVCRRDSWTEIHCHGGRVAAAAILADLITAGTRVVDWQEWSTAVFGPFQHAAGMALAAAKTERTAAILLDQWDGALERAVTHLTSQLTRGDAQLARVLITELLDRYSFGWHLHNPWRVVLAGPANVGKSSLFNALLGYRRSIVYDLPGTTRDVLTAATVIDGWPIELVDTAGPRETTDALEREGAERARHEATAADLLIDVAVPATLCKMPLSTQDGSRVLRVLNKKDQWPAEEPLPAGWLATCALSGEGIAELAAAISRALVAEPPPAGAPIPFTPAQRGFLLAIRQQIDAQDLRAAAELAAEMQNQQPQQLIT
jgi:tRNA modification GTPase